MRTATGLTPYDALIYNRPRPILHTALQLALLPTPLASPPVPTGLTPSPSPRGEGSDMPCYGVVGFVVANVLFLSLLGVVLR